MSGAGRRRAAGLTLVEIMVSVAIVGVVAGFLFRTQARLGNALRDQQTIAELQQTLRSAAWLIVKDVRQAGYLAADIRTYGIGDPNLDIPAVRVVNGAGGEPDTVAFQYASDKVSATIATTHPFNSAETVVDDASAFHDGDLLLAVHTVEPKLGWGCLLMVTHDPQLHGNGGDKIQHNPGQGQPWNGPGNSQCESISATWNDGYTIFTRVQLRAYRIKPGDPRGVLQMSQSSGILDDWENIALGIVDLQLAVRVYQPGDTVDEDGDGDPERDWYSGDLMSQATTLKPGSQLIAASVTLVAKTTKDVQGVALAEVPSLQDAAFPPAYNRRSDKGAVALPVTDTQSRYAGDVVFRTFSMTIDLRNTGIGVDSVK